jgi:hypothetical protein
MKSSHSTKTATPPDCQPNKSSDQYRSVPKPVGMRIVGSSRREPPIGDGHILREEPHSGRSMNTVDAPQNIPHSRLSAAWLTRLALALLLAFVVRADDSTDPAFKPLRATAKNHVAIQRAALNRDFLLSGSVIPQFTAATSTGLAGKIVRFELFSDGVDLYETTDGLIVTEDLPARRLLTTFALVEENADEVIIDFGAGMRRVFTDIWYSTSRFFNPASSSRSMELTQSRIFEVSEQGDRLVIRQSAQMRDRQVDPNREERYEVRYFLGLYTPTDFVAKEMASTESRYLRFFETQPRIESVTGRPATRIARFDIRKPIVFYYSANTPDDYVQAVQDGILYWNRAFGREVIQAKRAPEGVTAPDARYNVIQWVPWDNAGFAYADLLVDPRTGASRHGQAFITSVFAISGKARARALLRAMHEIVEATNPHASGESGNDPHHPTQIGDSFFPSSSVCQIDHRQFALQLVAGMESMLAQDELTDAAVLRASQDYVRQVTAHEVGHVLGLRHNFAGSLEATVNSKALEDWFRRYLTAEPPEISPEMIASSSIMDYTVFPASVFLGNQIRTSKEALPHDRAAIQWGYFDDNEARRVKLLFATDSDTIRYGDVRTFDYGAEPVVTSYGEIAEQIRNLPNGLIETFIRAKAPRDRRDREPLEEVDLRASSAAAALASRYGQLLRWFKADVRSLRIENAFDYVGELNRKEVLQAHWKSLNEQVDKLGGVDRALFAFMPGELKLEPGTAPKEIEVADKINANQLAERLKQLLNSSAYSSFVGLDDQTHEFTQAEKDLILERGRKFFEEFEKELVKRLCAVLERANRDLGAEATGMVGDDDIIAKFEKRIIDLAKVVLTAKDDSKRRRGRVDKSLVEVIDFKYDHDTRLTAARMLNDNVGSFKGWATDAKGELNKQLKDEVEAALNIQRFKEFQDSLLSRPLREWYLNQQAILALLPPKKGSADEKK